MNKLRVVLAGLGVRGMYWAEVLTRSPRCEIIAYVDPNPEACKRAIERYGEKPTFASADIAMTELPDVQALVLANPPIDREPLVRIAAERNIAMLIEKPLALSVEEAHRLVAIAEAANVPLMVGLNFRYLGVTLATLDLIRQQTVGAPAFARFTYERWRDGNRPDLNKYPLTMDHPMLWEQSIHHFDLMRYVYGQEPVLVQCQAWNPPWSMYAHETNIAALITFDGGMVVNYQGTWQANWAVPHFEWRTECSEGIISQRDQFGDLFYARQQDQELTPVSLPPHERWITETSGLLDAFVATVMEAKPLECSGRDHLMSLAMLEACIQSSSGATSVRLADILNRLE